MRLIDDAVVQAKLRIQKALLGEISESVRAVIFSVSENSLKIKFYLDGEISKDDRESASCVETEVIADYEDWWSVECECIRADAPQEINGEGFWVFRRREY
jgi:hypothetical protein